MDNIPKKDAQSEQRFSNKTSGQQHQEIIDLLKSNIEISQELLRITKKFQKFLAFQRVWLVVKFLIILVPLILGLIYLPPLLSGVMEQYQSLLEVNSGINTRAIQELLKQYAN